MKNFKITERHLNDFGGLHERANRNLAAIKLLKKIELENRLATDTEQDILVQYTGWGALPQCFNYWSNREWAKTTQELKDSVTDQEYQSIRESVNNAHYTSKQVISTIWKALQQLGIKKNLNILEPGCGIGNFIGLMPDELESTQSIVGIEIDTISARITKLLYPLSKIVHSPFEKVDLCNDFFDLVIGNVPFGNFPVVDLKYRNTFTKAIHDYFLIKSLDVVRNNGLCALITSRYTLDKVNSKIRQYLATKANLVCAYRFPSSTFKENAGTEVVTDLLIFQKTDSPLTNPRWLTTTKVDIEGCYHDVNQYFVDNPQNVLGVMSTSGSLYSSDEFTVIGNFNAEQIFNTLPTITIHTPISKPDVIVDLGVNEYYDIKDGGFGYDNNGFLCERVGNKLNKILPNSNKNYRRIIALIEIRNAVRKVFKSQLEDSLEIDKNRQELNDLYDNFVERFGAISNNDNKKAFSTDPDYPLLKSLEIYDSKTGIADKTEVFYRQTLFNSKKIDFIDNCNEALLVCLNEYGKVDWQRISELTRKSIQECQQELVGSVFLNPSGHTWETADQYLSGNVKVKLQDALIASKYDEQFEANVLALKEVQPRDLQPGEIDARLGASWIPTEVIKDFVNHLLDTSWDTHVGHSEEIAEWTVTVGQYAKNGVKNTTTWGTNRTTATELILDALNSRTPTVYDVIFDGENEKRIVNPNETLAAREKQQQIKEHFQEWVWKHEKHTATLIKIYNDRFNSVRLREFDGKHLTFPEMNKSGLRKNDLDDHQKNAVWRILQTDNALLGHVVGSGKTLVAIAACMELKRLGLASKSMIVVPNHLVEQWATEFYRFYPNANLFVLGKDDFKKGKREVAMSRIATGNYDAIIISHRSFEFLPVSDEMYVTYTQNELQILQNAIEEMNEGRENTRIIKRLEAQKKRLKAKIEKNINKEKKDTTITFEELGIDQLFVDESDAFKNLGFVTKMDRIAGLSNTDSMRSFDMFMKIQYISQSKHTRGTVFATGTPISNTIAEMYTLMRYLYSKEIKKLGIHHFDAWAADFAEAVTGLEISPDGSGYRVHVRFSRFINIPELMTIFRSFADIKTAEMLNLPRPELETGKPIVVSVPASNQQRKFIQSLVKRAERLRTEKIDPHIDNMLMVTNDGRKCALDIRLVASLVKPDTNTKADKMVENVYEIWKNSVEQKLTQMIFLDISTPNTTNTKGFNVYEDVRNKLTNKGIPLSEIAFIHDAETDEEKSQLFSEVNDGKIRVLMGSTEKMGSGTNAQKRLYALHHLDAPWRPRDIEQRDGRILRPGNTNKTIRNYRYVTEGSFDAYMWQCMESKAKFIAQVINGTTSVRKIEDIETTSLTYAEVKAIASGNPMVIEKVKIDSDVRRLESLRSNYYNQQWKIRRQMTELPFLINNVQKNIELLNEDIKKRDENTIKEFLLTIGTKQFTDRDEAAEALLQNILSWTNTKTLDQPRGIFKGFTIHSEVIIGPLFSKGYLFLQGAKRYELNLNGQSAIGTLMSIEHAVRSFETFRDKELMRLADLNLNLKRFNEELTKTFEYEDKLNKLLDKQDEINNNLDLTKSDLQTEFSEMDDCEKVA